MFAADIFHVIAQFSPELHILRAVCRDAKAAADNCIKKYDRRLMSKALCRAVRRADEYNGSCVGLYSFLDPLETAKRMAWFDRVDAVFSMLQWHSEEWRHKCFYDAVRGLGMELVPRLLAAYKIGRKTLSRSLLYAARHDNPYIFDLIDDALPQKSAFVTPRKILTAAIRGDCLHVIEKYEANVAADPLPYLKIAIYNKKIGAFGEIIKHVDLRDKTTTDSIYGWLFRCAECYHKKNNFTPEAVAMVNADCDSSYLMGALIHKNAAIATILVDRCKTITNYEEMIKKAGRNSTAAIFNKLIKMYDGKLYPLFNSFDLHYFVIDTADDQIIQRLIDEKLHYGVIVNAYNRKCKCDWSAILVRAAVQGNVEVTEFLIKKGVRSTMEAYLAAKKTT